MSDVGTGGHGARPREEKDNDDGQDNVQAHTDVAEDESSLGHAVTVLPGSCRRQRRPMSASGCNWLQLLSGNMDGAEYRALAEGAQSATITGGGVTVPIQFSAMSSSCSARRRSR